MRIWLSALMISMMVPASVGATRVAYALPQVQCGALTLSVKPGINPSPPGGSSQAAPDSPQGTFRVSLPLYPGLTPVKKLVGTPYASLPADAYLQTSAAEYQSDAGDVWNQILALSGARG